jgi:hypothetical protein
MNLEKAVKYGDTLIPANTKKLFLLLLLAVSAVSPWLMFLNLFFAGIKVSPWLK